MEALTNQALIIDASAEICGSLNCSAIPAVNAIGRPKFKEPADWKRYAQQLQREIYVAYFVFRHPLAPWYSKLLAALGVGYVLSPIQFIPSFIPFIGFIDDLLVLVVLTKLMHKVTPDTALAQCRAKARSKSLQVDSASSVFPVVAVGILLALISGFCAWGCWVSCHLTRR
jgi:uncharacterized membrane protein YkvA (DUF1232 family)